MSDNKEELKCSFCNSLASSVQKLISGPSVCICDGCIEACNKMLDEEIQQDAVESFSDKIMTPKQIHEHLNQHIIGQEHAKRILSVAVYNHYKRVLIGSTMSDDVELAKSNILLAGPTGSGKTLLAQTLAKILDVPFCIADATTLTEAGYVGDDVEVIVQKLLQAAEFDREKAEMGIIYVDEIDKITRKAENMSVTRDVSGEGVQQALLKMIEGTVVRVPVNRTRKHPNADNVEVDTGNILFIVGGAFAGLDKIIQQRTNESSVGFGARVETTGDSMSAMLNLLESEDLVSYGLIPEFIGRLPIVATLEELDEEALVRILTEPKNAIIKQYKKLMALEDVTVDFTDDALKVLAAEAIKRKSGARGLRAILEGVLLDTMYDVPQMQNIERVIVTEASARGLCQPLITLVDEKAS